ncbi:MAG: Cys-tRNA(Pro) deacylase [Roseburia sp.]|nr:Cys-tRNA(Pro) deacylase [Anaeroplasma bactoclasticum]MCM1195750.1 Cys-tRNA(Pro) deacylase [Roseburia sp.]MCM1556975.1 Cys-tRNA(Pro) deacylase [Anaeroplasma bactoclasticum]
MEKTNVMRILDQKKIPYEAFEYPHEKGVCVEGVKVAKILGQNKEEVFKTLVAIGHSKHYYVFVIPVAEELDLKKAAKAVKEKSVELIPVKDLLGITGYIRGGCSPIGMKKQFTTILHNSVQSLENIIFSAGKIGYQVKLNPMDLAKIIRIEFSDIIHVANELSFRVNL